MNKLPKKEDFGNKPNIEPFDTDSSSGALTVVLARASDVTHRLTGQYQISEALVYLASQPPEYIRRLLEFEKDSLIQVQKAQKEVQQRLRMGKRGEQTAITIKWQNKSVTVTKQDYAKLSDSLKRAERLMPIILTAEQNIKIQYALSRFDLGQDVFILKQKIATHLKDTPGRNFDDALVIVGQQLYREKCVIEGITLTTQDIKSKSEDLQTALMDNKTKIRKDAIEIATLTHKEVHEDLDVLMKHLGSSSFNILSKTPTRVPSGFATNETISEQSTDSSDGKEQSSLNAKRGEETEDKSTTSDQGKSIEEQKKEEGSQGEQIEFEKTDNRTNSKKEQKSGRTKDNATDSGREDSMQEQLLDKKLQKVEESSSELMNNRNNQKNESVFNETLFSSKQADNRNRSGKTLKEVPPLKRISEQTIATTITQSIPTQRSVASNINNLQQNSGTFIPISTLPFAGFFNFIQRSPIGGIFGEASGLFNLSRIFERNAIGELLNIVLYKGAFTFFGGIPSFLLSLLIPRPSSTSNAGTGGLKASFVIGIVVFAVIIISYFFYQAPVNQTSFDLEASTTSVLPLGKEKTSWKVFEDLYLVNNRNHKDISWKQFTEENFIPLNQYLSLDTNGHYYMKER